MNMPLSHKLTAAALAAMLALGPISLFTGSATATTAACSAATPPAERPVLQYGARGECVRIVQQELVYHGLLDKQYITGNYLQLTKAAVLKYQQTYGLTPNGSVDRQTWDSFSEEP